MMNGGDLHLTIAMCVFLVVAFCGTSACVDRAQYDAYLTRHNKSLARDANYEARFAKFAEASQLVAQHNSFYKVGLHTFTMALNQFVDLV